MRNPERIPEILKELEFLWKEYDDVRLGQLFIIISKINPHSSCSEIFNFEDDKFLERLKEINKEIKDHH